MTTPWVRRVLQQASLLDKCATAPQISIESLESENIPFSMRTVQRLLNELGLRSRKPPKKKNGFNEGYTRKKVELGVRRRDWTVDFWRRVVFSDEQNSICWDLTVRPKCREEKERNVTPNVLYELHAILLQ